MKSKHQTPESLAERIERLERENRRFKRGIVSSLLVAMAVVVMAASNGSEQDLKVRSLTVLSEDGKPAITLSTSDRGMGVFRILDSAGEAGIQLNANGLRLQDQQKQILNIGHNDWGELAVSNPKGYDEQLFGFSIIDDHGHGRVGMGIYSDDSTSFFAVDGDGQFRIGLGVDRENYSKLKMYDRGGTRFFQVPKED